VHETFDVTVVPTMKLLCRDVKKTLPSRPTICERIISTPRTADWHIRRIETCRLRTSTRSLCIASCAKRWWWRKANRSAEMCSWIRAVRLQAVPVPMPVPAAADWVTVHGVRGRLLVPNENQLIGEVQCQQSLKSQYRLQARYYWAHSMGP